MEFRNATQALGFVLAGRAKVTLKSLKTGNHFTYQVKPAKDGKVTFVSLLTGPDNSSDFSYLGYIRDGVFMGSRKSCAGSDAPSFRAFAYAWNALKSEQLPNNCAVMHSGSCGRCGRELTDPESIATGIGPVCRGKL